jgi:hypothetical protein
LPPGIPPHPDTNNRNTDPKPICIEQTATNKKQNDGRAYVNYLRAILFVVGHWLWEKCPRTQSFWNFLVMLFTGLLALVAWQQYQFGKTSERAYVVFGSKDGTLAEFGKVVNEKKVIIKLHFFNAGQSVARHFAVQVHTCGGGGTFSFSQRHRTKGPFGEIMTSGSGNELDLGGQTEHPEYVTDPKQLWTLAQINQPKGCFWITGQMEYCDIFGTYHCESFGAEYSPIVGDFVARPFLRCIREPIDPRGSQAFEMGKTVAYKEIEPCEQPNEPEYGQEPKTNASAPIKTSVTTR